MDEIFIDLNFLTESERDQLQDVLARDDEFRRQEKKRLGDLKKELETVKKSSAIKVSETSNLQPGKVCARCHQTFGVVFNTGAFCPKCKAKVCKSCREVTQGSWLCSLCAKVREVKAKSGAWFFDQVKTKSEARSLFGTSLIRASLKRRKFSSSDSFDEIQTPPVIGLHNHGNNKLHRPIPVHMSAIRESSNDSKDQSRHNRDQIMNEINQNNSKPYSKAVPVKKQLHSSFSDNEDRESAGDSGNSTPTKLQYDDSEVIVTKNDHNISEEEKQKDDKEVFQFLDSIHHEMKNDPPDQSRDVSRDRQSYGNDDDVQTPETSLEFHSLPNELEQPGYTKDHLKVMKASERSTSISSVDSYRTAEFHTPTETPGHSDFNTPVQSLPGSDDESDFLDAHDAATPVPERADEFHSLPQDEYLPQSESPQVMQQQPQIDVIPPQIITTAVEDPTGGPHVTDDNEENPEDIDQAFAFYGSKSSLSFDRFEMGSRESIVSYYSDAGEGHFGNIPVTGEVQFGLKYDHRAGKLEVQIHRARDIAPVDTKKNKSDPYVKVYLLPDKTKGGKRKTRTKKNTLNPEFDEILTFKVGFDEMLTRSIWLTVWNHDRFGHNDFLGEIIFALESYEQSGFSWDYPSPEWYPLQERRPEPSLMEYCGELIVALKYVPPESIKDKKSKKKAKKGNLYVAMVEAHNLPSKDSNGFSDPFCKAYLLPDKSRKTKRKTPTIKKNLNPKWEHTIVYENLTLEDLMDRVLELTVWDWDRGMSNSFLGGVRLGMGARQEEWDDAEGEEIDAWRTMIDNPNEWNRFTLTLRSLSRFKDKPSDIEADVQSQESEARQPENRDQKTEESRLNPKPEEHKGIVNMAYSQTNGDDQEEKDMGIFKSFNNFTSRFKFMPDKIEDTKPPEANYGTFDSSPKKSDEATTNSYQSGINSNEANGVTEIPDKDQNSQRTIDEQTNEISEKKESTRATPEVPTIVTGSQPNSPQKKDETDGQTSSHHARRNTDNVCFFEGATLSPDLDLRRRHSTDVVSVPQPLNEELVLEDFKKRGSPFQRRSTKKKQIPDHSRRESYSPRMERKQKNSLTSSPVETRRKTLAELALESGYKPKSDVVDGSPKKDLTVNAEHDKVISASGRKSPSPIRISGELYLTLEYCMETKAFIVHVHTANNIAVVDHKKQSSNPYVKTYLLPDKKSKRKTKTVRDNLNPQFDEVIKYPMSYDELLTRTLSLTVWHDDLFGRKDFLGEVVIPIGQFVDQGNSLENSIAKWYTLEEKVDHENDNKPEIILAVKYVSGDKVKRKPGNKKSLPSRGEMQLQILEAKNLPGKDADGMSDPFCKILLHPDKKGKTKHQTKKIDRTLNPVWNYKLSFEDLSIEDLYDRVLDITVWDHDMMSRDEFLGGVRLGTGERRNEWDDSNDAEAQIWHTMLNRTNVWIQVVVPLRPNMEIRKAT